jgi:hypothetical protein
VGGSALKKQAPQIDRFKEAARQLEADESDVAFDEKLKAIAKSKTIKNEKSPRKTP